MIAAKRLKTVRGGFGRGSAFIDVVAALANIGDPVVLVPQFGLPPTGKVIDTGESPAQPAVFPQLLEILRAADELPSTTPVVDGANVGPYSVPAQTTGQATATVPGELLAAPALSSRVLRGKLTRVPVAHPGMPHSTVAQAPAEEMAAVLTASPLASQIMSAMFTPVPVAKASLPAATPVRAIKEEAAFTTPAMAPEFVPKALTDFPITPVSTPAPLAPASEPAAPIAPKAEPGVVPEMPAQVLVTQASLAQPPAVPPQFVPETSTVIEIPASPEPHLQIPDAVKVPVATGLIRGVAQNAAKVVIAQVTRHTIPDVVAQPVITEAPSEQQSVTPAAAIPELPTTDVQCQEPVLNKPPVASAHLQATVATAPLPLASEKPGQRAPDAANDVPASQPEQVPQTALPPAVPTVKAPFAVQNKPQPQLATAQPVATAAPSARPVMNAVDRLLALGQYAWPPHEIMAAIGHPAKSVTQSPASAEHRQASAPQSLIPVVEPLESPDNPASDLAFTMRLNTTEPTRPVTTAAVTPPPTPVISDAPTPELPNPAPIVAPVESQPAEVPAVAPTIVHPPATAPVAPAKQQKPRSDDEPELPHTDPKPPVLTRSIPPSAAETTAQSGRTVAEPQTQKAEPTRPAELVPPEPPAETKPAGAVRDIKLQVAGGSQRVEVRLTERGGEVQVAVRTPDSHLAGTLRENLPTLSTRLADNGFRADTWHPAAPAAEWRRSTETSQGNLAQEQNPHSGGQQEGQQSGGDPRQPRAPEAPSERKEKGKDFAWLMSNLQ